MRGKNEQEAHKVVESEAGSNAGWVCIDYWEDFRVASDLRAVDRRTLYHAVVRVVVVVFALAEDEGALRKAAVLIRTLRLKEVVEENSFHPCSSLVKPLWI